MLETTEQKKAFLASCEMSYDPMYQKDIDTLYHHWMQDKWKEVRKLWKPLSKP